MPIRVRQECKVVFRLPETRFSVAKMLCMAQILRAGVYFSGSLKASTLEKNCHLFPPPLVGEG
ncbi:hypothetical protein ACKLNO_11950 [Neisseriaceae bacterium B1]